MSGSRTLAGLVFVDDVAAAYEQAPLSELQRSQPGWRRSRQPGCDRSDPSGPPEGRLRRRPPDIAIAADVSQGELREAFPALPATSLAEGEARTIIFYREQATA